jgi:hypothetical protein
VVDGLDADGSACTHPDGTSWHCPLGAIAPGEARSVRMRLHGTAPATVTVSATAEAGDDGYAPNNSTGVQLRIDNAVDVGILMASGGSGVEDQDIQGQVSLRSGGRNPAQGATLDVELNAAGTLGAAWIHEGADCALLSATHARCALPAMARDSQVYVNYRATFAEPGTYDVNFTLNVPGDSAPQNDTLTRAVLVRPYNDIGVAGTLDLTELVTGESREQTFVVTSGRRALASAHFVAPNYLPGLKVTAIRASAGECRVDPDAGGVCDFPDLAPDSKLSVTVTWHAVAASQAQVATVSVSSPGDVVVENNQVTGSAEVLDATDLELRVDASRAGAAGAMLEFPPISVINGGERAVGTRLEISLPAQVSLISVSAANAICSGTSLLRCDFSDLDANSTSTVNISVRAVERGNYVSSLQLTSINDSNPANDQREVQLQISGSASAAAVNSGNSGGGGSFEWLSLALLGALLCHRLVRISQA